MKIHELKIEGFKSIGSITLVEPNPFSVFVGPNGAGKSNIFEALEFFELCQIIFPSEVPKLFGNIEDILNNIPQIKQTSTIEFYAQIKDFNPYLRLDYANANDNIIIGGVSGRDMFPISSEEREELKQNINYKHFINFSRIFIREPDHKVRRRTQDDSRLTSDASNLEKVLKRIFKNQQHKEEIVEILQLLIPGFSDIDIITEELSGSDNLVIYDDFVEKRFTKNLISDGTYNILAIIAAIYQSEEPQFLLIEEPENGLNPKVVQLLVELFRDKCKEKGHYIWLNTHSQTLVAELTPDEIILVDKVKGQTRVKQVKGFNLHGLRMDDALFTNALGGGMPW